jgi:hypothetical protein
MAPLFLAGSFIKNGIVKTVFMGSADWLDFDQPPPGQIFSRKNNIAKERVQS